MEDYDIIWNHDVCLRVISIPKINNLWPNYLFRTNKHNYSDLINISLELNLLY